MHFNHKSFKTSLNCFLQGDNKMMIVRKAAKEAAKKIDVRFPDQAIEALDVKVMTLVQEAADRAKKNGRVTIKPFDL
jgi:histone H3/H4